MSWNELIGGCLQALTSHLHLVVGLRALRLSGCRLSAGDLSALGGSTSLGGRVSRVRAQLKPHRLCRGGAELHVPVGDPPSVLERRSGGRRFAGRAGQTGPVAAGAPPGVL